MLESNLKPVSLLWFIQKRLSWGKKSCNTISLAYDAAPQQRSVSTDAKSKENLSLAVRGGQMIGFSADDI